MKKLWKVLKESPLLLAVLLVMFGLLTGGSVQAEEIWEVPVEVKYDITEEHYVFDFTLETEENLYLAYYKGKEVDRESAFETAIFTKSKSVRTNPDYLNCCIMLWVVDGENNIIADAYPQYGGEVLTGATDIYHMCWGTDAKYGFWDQEFGETVEYVNGEQLCDLVATVKNGELIVNLPETESGEQAELKVYAYADDLYVGHGSTYVFLKGGKATINLSWLIEEADEYIFVYWIKGEGIRTRNQYMSYTYEKPEQKVNPVTNLKWDEESTGKFTFTQDNDENISYYEYSLEYKEVGEDSFEKIGGAESRSIFSAWYFYDSDKDIYSYDGAKYYIDENYVYRVAVRALSDNIEIYTHSDWVYSEIYDPFQLIVPTPENQVAAFVNRMYTVALGRETEEEGATWWTEALLAGSSDGAGLAQGFLTGDEFANKGYSNAEYVAVLYDTFFNREIAEGEGDFWVNALNYKHV